MKKSKKTPKRGNNMAQDKGGEENLMEGGEG